LASIKYFFKYKLQKNITIIVQNVKTRDCHTSSLAWQPLIIVDLFYFIYRIIRTCADTSTAFHAFFIIDSKLLFFLNDSNIWALRFTSTTFYTSFSYNITHALFTSAFYENTYLTISLRRFCLYILYVTGGEKYVRMVSQGNQRTISVLLYFHENDELDFLHHCYTSYPYDLQL